MIPRKVISLLILTIIFSLLSGVDFDIEKFSRPDKYGWDDHQIRRQVREHLLERRQLIDLYEQKRQNISTNMLKSAIIPGWGHFSAQRYTKGEILLTIELVLFGTSLYLYDKALENYGKYKKADYIQDIIEYYNDASTPFVYAQGFFAVGMMVWIYTFFDSIRVTDEYNADLWDQIFHEYQDTGLKITPMGITYRF